ncbi:hypothetical protein D5R81_02205 [Parashewanella spongiae]|uniref:Exopolysaccharide biosynthesis protein n=1 Tax=Parashewanella spongiae TaxID=342950 RepID=A0A3A6U4I7_9GAMM|nr:Rcs stress response system protein RcsF [Parashewanella spongiae]MCL1079639.1 hypothetical protein [Parashewanella spongiae]RJY19078.1 hypothetical protein D5R81_02205 [Parashewanella spongiae]
MKHIILFIFTVACSGCSNYTFNSNIDAQAYKDYFKASDVAVYEAQNHPKKPFKNLKMVNGDSCQISQNDKPASIAEARTKARRTAADLGADGIIIKHCSFINIVDSSCITQAICTAQAIKHD